MWDQIAWAFFVAYWSLNGGLIALVLLLLWTEKPRKRFAAWRASRVPTAVNAAMTGGE